MHVQQTLFDAPAATEPGKAVSPLLELGAYELLWADPKASFKRLAARFRSNPDALPSDLVDHNQAMSMGREVVELLREKGVEDFGIRVHRAGEYPEKLRDAEHPIEVLYYRGWWGLVEAPSVAVVGTRKPTPQGLERTRELVQGLVVDGWTIVSGLAAGTDTAAHQTALEHGGETIAVIGTPISETYPKENRELQALLAKDHLVISQVPVVRYYRQTWKVNRFFFPERNVTMAALTEATLIVEAGETSGTLTQARAALAQGRKVLILDRCFENPELTWPAKFKERGAIRVRDIADIRSVLDRAQPNR